ncbi:HipA domain-containing protein [Nocardioides sp. Bht2]|uniref:HipA domain-containing protein n=1 Tax=Nocardioides sp. Bht2 TaxID=3392297 RepID=UPI0039B387C9
MAPNSVLHVWLRGRRIAVLDEPSRYRYRLTFAPEAIERFGVGSRVLSLSLPIGADPLVDHPHDPTKRPVAAFLEGLLPEGNLRAQLAAHVKVAVVDKMALLDHVGAECAGAVQFLRTGHVPGEGTVTPLSRDEVTTLVESLPTSSAPDGTHLHASLAGIQDKLLLTRVDDGWGWPSDGAPSSHLIKPEPLSTPVPHLVHAEHWALEVAARVGLPAAQSTLQVFGSRTAIVVRRYDRAPDGRRAHQEDFCQALGLDPSAKYELQTNAGNSRLRQLAALAAPRAASPDSFRRTLLQAVCFNALIGNADAHSKNYSLMIEETGEVSLAPLYDVAPVRYLSPRFKGTGHLINGRGNLDHLSLEDLITEGSSWGTSPGRVRNTVAELVDAVWVAAHSVTPPDGVHQLIPRLEAHWGSRGWR